MYGAMPSSCKVLVKVFSPDVTPTLALEGFSTTVLVSGWLLLILVSASCFPELGRFDLILRPEDLSSWPRMPESEAVGHLHTCHLIPC
jgi:hypothetical protein